MKFFCSHSTGYAVKLLNGLKKRCTTELTQFLQPAKGVQNSGFWEVLSLLLILNPPIVNTIISNRKFSALTSPLRRR